MTTDTSVRPDRAFDVQTSTIDRYLYLVRGSDAYRLGDVEREIWRLCEGKLTIAEIAASIASQFEVDEDVATQDVQAFVEQMMEAGLVEAALPPQRR